MVGRSNKSEEFFFNFIIFFKDIRSVFFEYSLHMGDLFDSRYLLLLTYLKSENFERFAQHSVIVSTFEENGVFMLGMGLFYSVSFRRLK